MLLFSFGLVPQVCGVRALVGLNILELPLLIADGVKLRAFGATVSCPLRHMVCLSGRSAHARNRYFRLSGTTPPDSISFVMTCLCSQTFISAEPSSAPV